MRATYWIIDGNNFIHRDSQLNVIRQQKGGLVGAAKWLENELIQFRSRQGRSHSVVLVFDGVVELGSRSKGARGFRILRPAPGQDADFVVVDEARRFEGRGEVNVISDDRAHIGARLRGLEVVLWSVTEFSQTLRPRRRMRSNSAEELPPEDLEKPPYPTAAEADDWAELFYPEADGDD